MGMVLKDLIELKIYRRKINKVKRVKICLGIRRYLIEIGNLGIINQLKKIVKMMDKYMQEYNLKNKRKIS
jgi:hypothetical protein